MEHEMHDPGAALFQSTTVEALDDLSRDAGAACLA
jgi:hypothetical protein